MNIKRYLEIMSYIGRVGKPLREVENWIMERYGVSLHMARYYLVKLRKEGLIRYRRPFRKSKRIWVELTRKGMEPFLIFREPWEE